MQLQPIGVIHTPYKKSGEAPRQGRYSRDKCVMEIFSAYTPGLKDITEASHLIVLYWCSQANREKLQTKTPYSDVIRGVFACRSPSRPNPIAFCVAELVSVEGNKLTVRGLDALDGSPLLDIKPYSPGIDALPEARLNWLDNKS
ncbi:tRNA (N6-threonylcarbamoyladenosine(37)-N6)-methyltransferase TrmO [Desulfallas thermosapovorans]|uniref:tRNA-Thr(GGU) m(6)t(6)A37 methyltransferase TsaA n=1 Tax=Desulfallas thermosapovorans DSM 6562 TaxID=1121431 RepID=A0A5S4ZT83_9FIRM|nr:tRNA (N6-threonylcarbamoyladenosine(37)-N6)-methyltransferase TrmO [Desulfallas thermosapovorans]TYO95288.1 tRNA-Thr(GGU) m(6)t(6)A37 methyltransferase TsaA [Desulfallas thermosapovorans DSM 6562]